MSLELKLAAWLASVLLVLGTLYGAYHYGRQVESTKRDLIAATALVASQKAIADSVAANQTILNQLKEKENEANNVIDALVNQPRPRVHVPVATCPSISPPLPADGSLPSLKITGLLSEQVEGILDSDRQRTESIVGECEHELNTCREVKEWACRQNNPD